MKNKKQFDMMMTDIMEMVRHRTLFGEYSYETYYRNARGVRKFSMRVNSFTKECKFEFYNTFTKKTELVATYSAESKLIYTSKSFSCDDDNIVETLYTFVLIRWIAVREDYNRNRWSILFIRASQKIIKLVFYETSSRVLFWIWSLIVMGLGSIATLIWQSKGWSLFP